MLSFLSSFGDCKYTLYFYIQTIITVQSDSLSCLKKKKKQQQDKWSNWRTEDHPPLSSSKLGCLLVLEVISIFHHWSTAGFVSQLHIRLNTSWAAAQPGPLRDQTSSHQARKAKGAKDCLRYALLVFWFVLWITSLTSVSVLLLKMFSASALWPLLSPSTFFHPFHST